MISSDTEGHVVLNIREGSKKGVMQLKIRVWSEGRKLREFTHESINVLKSISHI